MHPRNAPAVPSSFNSCTITTQQPFVSGVIGVNIRFIVRRGEAARHIPSKPSRILRYRHASCHPAFMG